MPNKKPKEFTDYLDDATTAQVSHNLYRESPAVAFLKSTLEIKDTFRLCTRVFPKKSPTSKDFAPDSIDSFQNISASMLPFIMGHFETCLRYLFAGCFDYSIYLKSFSMDNFSKKLLKDINLNIPLSELFAYRRADEITTGLILSDNLFGWHNPDLVNYYFSCFGFRNTFFSNTTKKSLDILWQFRHSIVHTGGTLIPNDALKNEDLFEYSNAQIVFKPTFINELSRKFHMIIKNSLEPFSKLYIGDLKDNIPEEEKCEIIKFFEIKSSVPSWLK